jgi:DNA-binding beta-propeller fold protein YncE
MFFPHQTAYDQADGTYWIADTNNRRVIEVNSSGACLENWDGGGQLKSPRGIAWDGTSVWVADAEIGQVLQCTPAGSCTVVAKGSGTPTKVSAPWNLTLAQGELWIADEGAAKIVVMTLTGSPVFTFGSRGANPSIGEFVSPRSVAVNPVDGEVAVADFGANVISLWH